MEAVREQPGAAPGESAAAADGRRIRSERRRCGDEEAEGGGGGTAAEQGGGVGAVPGAEGGGAGREAPEAVSDAPEPARSCRRDCLMTAACGGRPCTAAPFQQTDPRHVVLWCPFREADTTSVLFEERRFVLSWAKTAGATSANTTPVSSVIIGSVVAAYAGRACSGEEAVACSAVLGEMLADSEACVEEGVVPPYRALKWLKEHSGNALYAALSRVPAGAR